MSMSPVVFTNDKSTSLLLKHSYCSPFSPRSSWSRTTSIGLAWRNLPKMASAARLCMPLTVSIGWRVHHTSRITDGLTSTTHI